MDGNRIGSYLYNEIALPAMPGVCEERVQQTSIVVERRRGVKLLIYWIGLKWIYVIHVDIWLEIFPFKTLGKVQTFFYFACD